MNDAGIISALFGGIVSIVVVGFTLWGYRLRTKNICFTGSSLKESRKK